MKAVEPLLNSAITSTALKLGAVSTRVDIISYMVGAIGPTSAMLRSFDKFRLIMGYFDAEDLRRCRAFVSQFRPSWKEQAEFRVLRDSHAKLLVFQTMPLTAIVTSSNILSRAYETAVVVRGRPAKFFASAFDDFWARSELIKPLDLEVLKKTLETGVFEDRRESIIPDPSNQKPATRR